MQQIIRLLIPFLLLFSLKSYGQAKHFTNFRMAPLTVNPALTGAFNGTYRLTGVYRGQWTSVSNFGGGQLTPHMSIDLPILGGILMENDWIGAGLSIVSDNAGRTDYRTGFAGMSATYHMGMDDDYSRVFSVGFQYGQQNRSFSNNLLLPEQLHNGGTLSEPISFDSEGNTDNRGNSAISIGVTYKATINDDGDLWRGGLAIKGIGNTNGSFISPRDTLGNSNTNINKATIIGFGQASMMMTEKVRLNPAIIFQSQPGFFTVEAQATADYMLNPKKRQILTGGLGYRTGHALNIILGMQIKDLTVGFAYDVGIGGLAEANTGFELSVGYIGKIYKKPQIHPVIFCPRL